MEAKDLTPVSVAVIRRGERLTIEIIPIEKQRLRERRYWFERRICAVAETAQQWTRLRERP
jgi:hypothetical protein